MAENDPIFLANYATRVAGCKRCKVKLEKGTLRLGKRVPNPFTDDNSMMMQWYHVDCIFDSFKKARATTKIISSLDDIAGLTELKAADLDIIKSKLGISPSTSAQISNPTNQSFKIVGISFSMFCNLVSYLASESSHKTKSDLVREFIKTKPDNTGFNPELERILRLLLPGVIKRVYNVQDKQIASLFAQLINCPKKDFATHLEQGDCPATVGHFFKSNKVYPPAKESILSLKEVDDFLDELNDVTRDEDRIAVFRPMLKKCTVEDLTMIMRLVKHDLRINARAKQILDGLDPKAYDIFQTSHDLKALIKKVIGKNSPVKSNLANELSISLSIMTPVRPMLAEACKSVEQALAKCTPSTYLLSEIKYDGERLQIHKQNQEFRYFSRSLKPVAENKVAHLKEFIPKAFPSGDELILDAEILLYDIKEKKPLPFGTLGVHKRTAFADATVCLFVFDCIWHNGASLLKSTIHDRRSLLETMISEIPGRVLLSETYKIREASQLSTLLDRVFKQNLEGLVCKPSNTIYEPGKRHWLKIKKDYLGDGSMADSADLVLLGAYFGTGNKGGLMSVFLMGAYNESCKRFQTVTKCGNGFTDARIKQLQSELTMVKISKDASKVPAWLDISNNLLPDFVVADPKSAPVWEITGAEFSRAGFHTARAIDAESAEGISIRFPRVTKERNDKTWAEATSVERLEELYEKSLEVTDIAQAHKYDAKRSSPDGNGTGQPSQSPPAKKRHREADDAESTHLSDVFVNIVFRVHAVIRGFRDYDKLKRKLILFGAELSETDDCGRVTHYIVQDLDTAENLPENVQVVDLQWIKKCLKDKTRAPLPQTKPNQI